MKFSKKIVTFLALLLTVSMIFGSMTAVFAEESSDPVVSCEETEQTQDIEAVSETVDLLADIEEGTDVQEVPEEADTEEDIDESEDAVTEEPSEEGFVSDTEDTADPSSAEETQDNAEDEAASAEDEEKTADENTSDVSETEEPAASDEEGTNPDAEEKDAEDSVPAKEDTAEIQEDSEETEVSVKPAAQTGTPEITGEFTDDACTAYRVTVTGAELESHEYYRLKIWSKTNGTDDRKWILLSQTETGYETIVNISDFNDPGYFFARVYLYKKAESAYEDIYLKNLDFTVPTVQNGSIKVSGPDKTKGIAIIKAEGISSVSGITSVKAVAYSKNDKSNQYEYSLKKSSDGTYKTTIDVANHGGAKEKYTVIVYATDGNGFEVEVGSKQIDFSGTTGTLKVSTNTSTNKYSIKVNYFTSAEEIKSMKVALWSDKNGKDDLKWHTMSISASGRTIAYSAYLKDFKDFGLIHAQLYMVKKDGTKELYKETSFTIKAPKADSVTVSATQKTGKFNISVKNLKSTYVLRNVRAMIWSKADKSDCKWYTLTASGNNYSLKKGSIADFENLAGTYNVKVYAYTKNGPTCLLKKTKVKFSTSPGTITYADTVKKTYGKMQKNYKVTLSTPIVKKKITKVEFAVWNESDSSNIKWYTAKKDSSGNYYITVKILDFKKLGQYVTHVYVTDESGERYFLVGADIMKVTGKATGTVYLSECKVSKGTFAVSLKNPSAPAGVAGVKIKAWTKDDKSDLHTYTAKKQEDGSFKATVNIANHKYNVGTYHLELYGTMGNGIKTLAASKDYTFKGKNIVFSYKSTSHHRLVGIDGPTQTTNLKAAIWTEKGGQDDLKWIKLKKSGNQWTADVDLKDFSHSGEFNVHIYSGDTFLGKTTFTAKTGEAGKTGWYYENGYKFYYEYGEKKTDLTGMVSSPYRICINRECCTVTIYALDGDNGYIIPVIAMTCSVGLPGMETPTGTYYSDYKSRWEMLMGPSWGQYVTHVVEGVYIHSVAGSNTTSYNLSSYDYNNLGQPASHGCIRLNVRDAKWVYDNCPYGTEIYIYDSSYPGPFGKPETIKIPDGQNWDPTDPNI